MIVKIGNKINPLGLIHHKIPAKIKDRIRYFFSFLVIKYIENIIVKIKNDSEKPKTEFWINLGSKAKIPTTNKENLGSRYLLDNKYRGIIVKEEIAML